MNTFEFIALAALVTAAMACLDYAHARYNGSLSRARKGAPGARHATARWSVAAWAAGAICFYATIRYSMALLPFEGAGLYIGSWLGTGTCSPSQRLIQLQPTSRLRTSRNRRNWLGSARQPPGVIQ